MKKRLFLGALCALLGALFVVPTFAQEKVVKEVERAATVSYTHLTLPTNREV
nr:hypothetical protein [uncultured Porphyromonas sp.]